ncbi:unnamed protein product [Symbiodinium sp. CCMP2456]|nr:unnamed protein product [Symbiodinium sp. CCMP2456]
MSGTVSVSYIAWTYRAPVSCSVVSHMQATTAYDCSWTPRPCSESISSLPTIFRMTCPSSRHESTWHPHLHSDGVSATSVGQQPRICAHWRISVMPSSPRAFGLRQARKLYAVTVENPALERRESCLRRFCMGSWVSQRFRRNGHARHLAVTRFGQRWFPSPPTVGDRHDTWRSRYHLNSSKSSDR